MVKNLTGRVQRSNIDQTLRNKFGNSDDYASLCNSFNTSSLSQNINFPYAPGITEGDLKDMLSSLKIHKPSGGDEIRLRRIYYNSEKLKSVITKVTNDIFAKIKILV